MIQINFAFKKDFYILQVFQEEKNTNHIFKKSYNSYNLSKRRKYFPFDTNF